MLRNKLVVILLRFLWILLILNNEYFIFWLSAKNCSSTTSNVPTLGRFMLIGDPQITDDKSYDRPYLVMQITKFYSALYMQRNYKHLINALHPTDIWMMGDLLDNGREWNDQKFASEMKRFYSIFPTNINKIPTYYMVGNHDIGFGDNIDPHIKERFQQTIGPTSYTFEKYGYLFVVLDTVSLSSSDPIIRQDAEQVLHTLPSNKSRILMTHVPLYRSPQQTCGPFRQKGDRIKEGAGYQYQNLVAESLSQYILETVQPVVVFSGDDHDYCKIAHDSIVEITVPTFNMAQGLHFPGVMVLDIQINRSMTTDLCWLPSQIDAFLTYGYSMTLTVVLLVIWHAFQYKTSLSYSQLSKEEMGIAPSQTTKSIMYIIKRYLNALKDIAWVGFITYIICTLFM